MEPIDSVTKAGEKVADAGTLRRRGGGKGPHGTSRRSVQVEDRNYMKTVSVECPWGGMAPARFPMRLNETPFEVGAIFLTGV